MSIPVLLAFLPVYLCWFSILIALIALPTFSIIFSMIGLYKHLLLWVRRRTLRQKLKSKLRAFASPIRACGCVLVGRSETVLSVCFRTQEGSMSALIKENSLKTAIQRLHTTKCSKGVCVNITNCPNRNANSPYQMIAAI